MDVCFNLLLEIMHDLFFLYKLNIHILKGLNVANFESVVLKFSVTVIMSLSHLHEHVTILCASWMISGYRNAISVFSNHSSAIPWQFAALKYFVL